MVEEQRLIDGQDWTISIVSKYVNTKPLTQVACIKLITYRPLDKASAKELGELLLDIAGKL